VIRLQPKLSKALALSLLSLFFSFTLTGCNLYGGIDSPSGDEQILSAARACLDDGDFECAKNYYKQLSSSSNDVGQSEQAFAEFDEQNASMKNFAAAFGKGTGDIGQSLAKLAGLIASDGKAGQARRIALFNAFKRIDNVQESHLKALVQFLGGISFAAELLAEDAEIGPDGTYQLLKTDISANPTSCSSDLAQALTNCSHDTYKNLRVGTAIGTGSLQSASASDIDVEFPTFYMFNAAIVDLLDGVGNLTDGTSGTFANSTKTLAEAFTVGGSTALSDTTGAGYRYLILSQNIGL
jgi:hypothetical protein